MDATLEKAVAAYVRNFGDEPEHMVFAPGRVNFIGEHVDYNDGWVLPFALPFRTYVVGSLVKNGSKKSTVISCSLGQDNLATFEINSSLAKGQPAWANYVKGTIFQYLAELPPGFAFNATIASSVPMGSGLSSSASLEVAMATFLEQLAGITSVTPVDKALRCQRAEHTFADTPCGIMDQYISAMGCEKNLLLIDCRSREYKLVPFASASDAPVVVVTNSNVKHQLSGSEYPDRVRQCKEAVAIIKKSHKGVTALRDCTLDMLDSVKAQMPAVSYNRARHCIKEDLRTLATVKALEAGDYGSVGKYMTQSHRSLQEDFEVSCAELDTLVDLALAVDGVYGSRMTGGGFGGCTVTLVRRGSVDALIKHLRKGFPLCECYTAVPSAGAGVVDPATAKKRRPASSYLVPVLGLAAVLAVAIAVTMGVLRSRK